MQALSRSGSCWCSPPSSRAIEAGAGWGPDRAFVLAALTPLLGPEAGPGSAGWRGWKESRPTMASGRKRPADALVFFAGDSDMRRWATEARGVCVL